MGGKYVEYDIVISPEDFKPRHIFWIAIKSNSSNFRRFFPVKTISYKSDIIEGRVHNGIPVGLWSYNFKDLKEQVLFIR